MIRFSCPQCSREYVLADALAHLPLLCKGCGQRLNVPDGQPEPEPPPTPVKSAPRPAPVPRPPVAATPVPKPPPVVAAPVSPPPAPERLSEPELEPLLTEEPANGDADYYRSTLDVAEPPPSAAPHVPTRAAPARATEKPAERPASRRGIGLVVDVAVAVILLVGGVIAAEMLLGKSSAQVIKESAAAPKFPPTDLLIWLAGPVLFGLIYLGLGTRGRTVGGWLRRRAER